MTTAWPTDASKLIETQRELGGTSFTPWHAPGRRPLVAACFACFARGVSGRGAAGDRGWAAAALMHADRHLIAIAVVRGEAGAAYEPGLMALREGRLLEAAVRALAEEPEVVIANATGRDHPRRAGLALHLGAVLDIPSIGVTDRPLLAAGDPPAPERGATAPLLLDGTEVARQVRNRAGARPLVVHPGWRTDIDTAVAVVLRATRRARTPEPLRRARQEARRARAADERLP